jgi:hypothetical protein
MVQNGTARLCDAAFARRERDLRTGAHKATATALCRFKGVSHTVRLKSFNAAALEERNVAFAGAVQAGKAQRVVSSKDKHAPFGVLEAVRAVLFPARGAALCCVACCSRLRAPDPCHYARPAVASDAEVAGGIAQRLSARRVQVHSAPLPAPALAHALSSLRTHRRTVARACARAHVLSACRPRAGAHRAAAVAGARARAAPPPPALTRRPHDPAEPQRCRVARVPPPRRADVAARRHRARRPRGWLRPVSMAGRCSCCLWDWQRRLWTQGTRGHSMLRCGAALVRRVVASAQPARA